MAFSKSWLTIMSGAISVSFTVAGIWAPTYLSTAFFLVGLIAFVGSSYLLWRSERAKVIEFEDTSKYGFPNVRVADAQTVFGLFEGSDRGKIISLLRGGSISSWARPMMGTDFVFLPALTWPSHRIEFVPKRDPGGINQTYLRIGQLGAPADYFDVCMNKAELSRYWRELEIPESKCDIL
jgi:hypothetical protein